jgi:2-polyprenyl-3-methyl-5-hydroxy-6-metoxy-1,4-benzoquinol methylase
MQVEYSVAYSELYRRHWWWRAREAFLMDVLRGELRSSPPVAILDVGCGGGLFFERLKEVGEPHGVESDASMRTGRQEVDQRIHWGTLDDYEAGRRYKVILFLDVLEHVEKPEKLLESALRLLTDDGLVVVTVPAFGALWTKHDDVNEHFQRYTKGTLVPVTEAAGLEVRSLRYFFHWLFFAKLLVRASEAIRGRESVPSVPAVPGPLVNKTLYTISRLEQVCRLDRVLPFGSSLLYIGSPRERHR